MPQADWLIKNATIYDGSGGEPYIADIAIENGCISAIGEQLNIDALHQLDADGLALSPGFIDVHTHDDIEVLRHPAMLSKVSQGVTSVIVGNCGISAAPVSGLNKLPDPMNLLGTLDEFAFKNISDYRQALERIVPAINVAALVGHTALRAQVMDSLQRTATDEEITQMRRLLKTALAQGAIGLSSGLAYASAINASSDEVEQLAQELVSAGAVYTTHLRTEFEHILEALDEAFALGRKWQVPVIISHLKCAGKANWGRSEQVLNHIENAKQHQHIGCDCYPYSASSSTLDLKQVTDDFDILISWCEPHPEMAGKTLKTIAEIWQLSLLDTAKKLQPAGAIYHGMHEQDVKRFVGYAGSMIGSDGLPCDPNPHPRLWGSFARVLGHYVRDEKILSLQQAIYKMTALPAAEFGFANRGQIKTGYQADLVLFDPNRIEDKATFLSPIQAAEGINMVWVNGNLTYRHALAQQFALQPRAGQFLTRLFLTSGNKETL